MNLSIRPARKSEWHPRKWLAFLAVALLLTGLFAGPTGARRDEEDSSKPKIEPGAVEVRFADNSVLKLTLRDEKVEVVTPYGKLLIPVAEIQRIEFATRLSETDEKRIPVLIRNLGSQDFPTRDAASAELLKLQEKAYPALRQAMKDKDAEIVRRANELVEKIRDNVPAENLEIRPFDVIHTENSKISGRISAAMLKANTTQFGEVQVKLHDVRSLRAQGLADPEKVVNAVPPPASLFELQQQIGKVFHFTVTGTINGAVWGTDVYTLDSTLGTAAIHAGILKNGQTGVVKVKIIASPPMFLGSTRNGVTSGGYPQFQGAYEILKK